MIFRDVVDAEDCGASRYTGYVHKSMRLRLVCGHEKYRKISQGQPFKVRCIECERAAISAADGAKP